MKENRKATARLAAMFLFRKSLRSHFVVCVCVSSFDCFSIFWLRYEHGISLLSIVLLKPFLMRFGIHLCVSLEFEEPYHTAQKDLIAV